jgi:hypothetical protein
MNGTAQPTLNTEDLLPLYKVAASLGMQRDSETIKKMLKSKGIEPKLSMPYGRGFAQFYDKAQVLKAFPPPPPKQPPAPAKTYPADQVTMKRIDDLEKTVTGAWRDLEELTKFTKIELSTKVDVLLKGNQIMWKAMQEQQQLMRELLDAFTKPRS